MNGAGNDFVVIDNRFFRFDQGELSRLAGKLCRRRLGIGADGLLALCEPERPEQSFRMRYFNADGSRGTMCGNGARCLVSFARDAGIIGDMLVFDTDAGTYRAEFTGDGRTVRLWVPPPYPDPGAPAVIVAAEGGSELEVFPVWTGTEHGVCFVPDLGSVNVGRLGPRIRKHPSFAPAGVNVDFVQIVRADPSRESATVRARTYEKGVEAETLACGTGAIAAAIVAGDRYYRGANRIEVMMPGGTLSVGFDRATEGISNLYLEGPAETVYRGTIEIEIA